MGNHPIEKNRYVCGDCGEEFDDEDEADFHTENDHVPDVIEFERWECEICGEIYEDLEDAENCCLDLE